MARNKKSKREKKKSKRKWKKSESDKKKKDKVAANEKKKKVFMCHDCQKSVYEYHINNLVCRMKRHKKAYRLAKTTAQREQASEVLKITPAKIEEVARNKKDKRETKKRKRQLGVD